MIKEIKVDRRERARQRRKKTLIRNTLYLVIIAFVSVVFYFLISSNKREYRDLGIKEFNKGNYQEAFNYFDEASKEKQIFSRKMDIDILMYKGECLIKLSKYQEAYDLYLNITNKYKPAKYNRDNVEFLMRLTMALKLFYEGTYDNLTTTFDEGIERGYNELNLQAAICCEQKGDYVSMLNYFQKYQEHFNLNSLICYKISSYYLNNDQPDLAISYIENSKTISDNLYEKELLLNEIIYYEKIINFDKAYELAEIYIASYPDDKNGRNEYEFLKTRVINNSN